MVNNEIHSAFRKAKVFKWKVAEKLEIADTTFSRMLRREIQPEKKEEILRIIEDLKRDA